MVSKFIIMWEEGELDHDQHEHPDAGELELSHTH